MFMQMPPRKSWGQDSMIKAVEAVRKKQTGYKSASETQRPPRNSGRPRGKRIGSRRNTGGKSATTS